MKYVIFLLLNAVTFAAEPFVGVIESTSSVPAGQATIEYLSNGKILLIRQGGEGFKRASNRIDLTNGNFTQIQHHNHSYTELGKLEDWAKIREGNHQPAPQAAPKIIRSDEKKQILGREAEKIRIESTTETLEIWATPQLPPFYVWQAFCPEPMPAMRLEETYPALLRTLDLFPLLVTQIQGEKSTILFEVTKITALTAEQKDHPALKEQTYEIPADHRLMPHPLQEMKRMEEERRKMLDKAKRLPDSTVPQK